MNKPNNYENTSTGDFIPVELGGHYLTIKKVAERQSKTNKPMIVVAFDFDKNDSQPGYFMKAFENDIRPDKRWPNQGTMYILAEDKDGNCTKSLKQFINCYEKSNGCQCVWGEAFADQFKNKAIGGVFGLVEEEYNGKVSQRRKLRWFCTTDKVSEASVPDAKLLETKTSTPTAPVEGFDVITDMPF